MLDAEETHHCIHVLRHKPGDTLYVTNGAGTLFHGKIVAVSKSNVSFSIDKQIELPSLGPRTGIALGLTKSMDRMEWFTEKAVELGVSDVLFFQTQRSERSKLNLEKIRKTAISAMKQARHGHLPRIEAYASVQQLIEASRDFDQKFIAVCQLPHVPLSSALRASSSKLVVIGPEGDFTPEEIALCIQAQYIPVSLGNTILRAETAAIASATLAKLALK